ncbi:MAG: hypothetical protein ACD_23C00582G0002 [uncultured bacterium]|nr:MAG: hypothetical protein ACD_23C00582G0002 [uncultured bacterium]
MYKKMQAGVNPNEKIQNGSYNALGCKTFLRKRSYAISY